MYYLNKVVGMLTSPLALALVLAFIGFILVWMDKKWAGLWIIGGVIAWLWIWSMPIMRWLIGMPLEYEFLVDGRVPEVERFAEADIIVLLGGGMGREPSLSPYAEMSSNADRVWHAARLWKAGKASNIVSTGVKPEESTLGLLKDFGVDETRVKFLEARNTEEEAKRVREFLGDAEAKRVLLVTSAWHMKRARLIFNKYASGLEVICSPADFEYSMVTKRLILPRDFLPNVVAFMNNSNAVHEWIGLIGYIFFR